MKTSKFKNFWLYNTMLTTYEASKLCFLAGKPQKFYLKFIFAYMINQNPVILKIKFRIIMKFAIYLSSFLSPFKKSYAIKCF